MTPRGPCFDRDLEHQRDQRRTRESRFGAAIVHGALFGRCRLRGWHGGGREGYGHGSFSGLVRSHCSRNGGTDPFEPRGSRIRNRPPREAGVDAVRQEDAEHQSEHAASDERQYKKAKYQKTVEARNREASSGDQDGNGETERDHDGHRGGHDDVDGEKAQLSDEQQGDGDENDQQPDRNDEDEGHRVGGW